MLSPLSVEPIQLFTGPKALLAGILISRPVSLCLKFREKLGSVLFAIQCSSHCCFKDQFFVFFCFNSLSPPLLYLFSVRHITHAQNNHSFCWPVRTSRVNVVFGNSNNTCFYYTVDPDANGFLHCLVHVKINIVFFLLVFFVLLSYLFLKRRDKFSFRKFGSWWRSFRFRRSQPGALKKGTRIRAFTDLSSACQAFSVPGRYVCTACFANTRSAWSALLFLCSSGHAGF